MKLPILTNSRAKQYRRCPMLHYYTYELGYAPVERARALTLGDCVHQGLETWWRFWDESLSLEEFHRAADQADRAAELSVYDRVLGEELLTGYHCRWDDELYEVLAVEREFTAPIIDPITGAEHPVFQVSGKLDALVRSNTGVWIVEHKTSREDLSPGSPYWQRLWLDSQVSTYFAGARALGYEPAGCLYDVLGKPPKIEPRLATPEEKRKYTKAGELYAKQRAEDEPPGEYAERVRQEIMADPDRFYARREIVRFESELEAAALDLWHVADQIAEALERSRWPRNTDACFQYGRFCDFHGVCTGQVSLTDGTQFRLKESMHEELSNG